LQSSERSELPLANERREIALRALKVAALLAAVGALVFSRAPLCPFAALTHTPCPGCGLTRSTLAIVRGDLGAAFELQPFAFIMSPLLGAAVIVVVFNYVSAGRAIFSAGFGRLFVPTFGVLFLCMLAFWVARFFGVHGGPVPV